MNSKKIIKWCGIFLGLFFLLFAVLIFFAGMKLVVSNQSGQKIEELKIEYAYGKGYLEIASIPDKTIFEYEMGKIGEGSNFDLIWQDDGVTHKVNFVLYFLNESGDSTVKIIFLPKGVIEIYEGGNKADEYIPKEEELKK